ncbi:hypothetical protein Glove_227g82 [Diversispora epigaea]|uniref:CN hydrolase domain-containing protein n=1 Tax=Diversispora epigaea TaxID=1348612 RepID=A0A397IN67_9GLOM|nr:hypothetical protein Glove_227g82 [Diversispora epigaea]
MDRYRHSRTPSQSSPISVPISLKLHLLLPIFTVLTAFGPGFQSIITFTWLWFTLSIFYIRHITRWWYIFFYYMFVNIGTLIAFMVTMKAEVSHAYALTFAVGMVINLLGLTSLLMDRFAQRVFDSKGWARVMTFPCVWTGLWTLFTYNWILGDWGNYAFVFLGMEEIMQLASFTGIGGINFILAWSGPIGSDILVNWLNTHVYPINSETSSTNTTGSTGIDDTIAEVDHISSTDDILTTQNNRRQRRPNFTIPTLFSSLFIYLTIIFLVITYGSIRMSTALIPFFQRSVAEFAPTSLLNVGCVIRQEQIIPDNSVYIQTTQELAKNGSKIILWTEGSGTMKNQSELDAVISSIKNISSTYNAYIGVAYIFLGESKETSYNKLTVISSSGEIVMDYQKSHLVPFLETVRFRSGKAELQTYDSKEYGVIGGAICFDFNFPGFINQASSKKVNLMLEVSNTWGNYFSYLLFKFFSSIYIYICPVGVLHSRSNAIRSIENGFTLIRCNGDGISGVWGPQGQSFHSIPTTNLQGSVSGQTSFTFQVPLYSRVNTVYGIFKDTFGWICLGMSGIFLICMIILEKGSLRWRTFVKKWF